MVAWFYVNLSKQVGDTDGLAAVSQLPFSQSDRSLQTLLSLQQDAAVLETLPLHNNNNQLGPETRTLSYSLSCSVLSAQLNMAEEIPED